MATKSKPRSRGTTKPFWELEPKARARKAINWIEDYCRVPEGSRVGEQIKLRPWQKAELCKIYGNERAFTRQAIISFGKKNGKTCLAACLLLLHLVGPAAVPNTQLPSTAQSKDQAAVLFALAAKMARLNPELNASLTIRDTIKEIYCPDIGTLYKALSAEVSTAHGKSPIFAVHDELGQVRGPVSELYNAIDNAMGAHAHPLSIVISTQAPTDGDLLSILIDDARAGNDPSIVLSLYTADRELDPFSDEAIRQANPAYGDFLNAAEIRKQAENARRMPSRESLYRNYTLNQRVAVNKNLFSPNVWKANGGQPDLDLFHRKPVYGGLDLSGSQDLTALVLVAQGDDGLFHVWPHFWTPADTIRIRADRDRQPYHVWAERGLINAVPGVTIGYDWVAVRLAELAADCDIRVIRYDRWRIENLRAALSAIGADVTLEEAGQGFRDMAPAIDALETAGLQNKLRHGNDPVLTMCAANAVVVPDPAGNRKFDKSKPTGRIDGMVALAMAIGGAATGSSNSSGSIYDDPVAYAEAFGRPLPGAEPAAPAAPSGIKAAPADTAWDPKIIADVRHPLFAEHKKRFETWRAEQPDHDEPDGFN